MYLSERIWNEFIKVKTKEAYSRLLLSQQRNYNKWFVVLVGGLSAIGVLFFKICSVATLISSVAITLLSAIKFVGTKLMMNEDSIKKLENVVDFYFLQSNELEKLWYKSLYLNEDKDNRLLDKLYKILNKEKKINKTANSVVTETNIKILTKAEKEVNFYCEKTF